MHAISKISITLLVLLAAFSCQKPQMSSQRNVIRVSASVAGRTKAVETTDENLDGFKMDVISDGGKYINGASVTKDGSAWTTDSEYKWLNDHQMYFWCWAPATANGTLAFTSESAMGSESECVFSFTPAADPADHDDLIFAYSSEIRACDEDDPGTLTSGSSNGVSTTSNKVDLHFYHALAEVNFAVSTNDGTFSNDLTINSISLTGIAGTGVCNFDGTAGLTGFVWTPSEDEDDLATYTLDLGTDFSTNPASDDADWSTGSYTKNSTTYNLFSTKNLMLVIPQDLSAYDDAAVEIEFYRASNGETATKSVKISDTWLPGYFYKYKIKASAVGADIFLDYDLLVADWVNGGGNVSL